MFTSACLGGLLAAVSLCFPAARIVTAQTPQPPARPDSAPATQTATTPPASNRIYLDIAVDHSGQAVAGLRRQDFTLLDNKQPQTITSFAAVNGREAPVQVIVVIDGVNAPYQNVEFQRQQLDQYLRGESGNLSYPTAIVVLADDGLHAVTNSFTSDGNALSTALDHNQLGFRAITRSSGYYGATERFQICLKAMHGLVGSLAQHTGRKIIIWISPGWPLLSGPEVQLDAKQEQQIFGNIVSLANEMARTQITLYSIDPLGAGDAPANDWAYGQFLKGVTKPSQAAYGDLGLPVLVTQSGGIAFSSTNGVADHLRQCLTDAVPYYEISFDPSASVQKSEYHQLQVRVAGDGLKARTRQGYYSQP